MNGFDHDNVCLYNKIEGNKNENLLFNKNINKIGKKISKKPIITVFVWADKILQWFERGPQVRQRQYQFEVGK